MTNVCFWGATGLWVGLALGCGGQASIEQYTIPKAAAIQLPPPSGAPAAGSTSNRAGKPERMLGAIVPHRDQTWFFKLSGPVDPVAAWLDEFRQFVQTLSFDAAGNPQWELPEDWRHQPGSGMRFATLLIGTDTPPLELTVIALPSGDGDPQSQVLANVNRWRGQVSLTPLTPDQLAGETETVTLTSGATATLVNLVGTAKPSTMGGPFAGGMGLGGGLRADRPQPSAATPLTYDAPAGWKSGRAGGMRKAAFEVAEDGQRAEITVIDLPRDVGAAGDRLANVNRWRGQIGLAEMSGDEFRAARQEVPVGALTGDFVELVGQSQTILGVMVDQGDKTWFIKLQGDAPLAAKQKPAFLAFVGSLKFGSSAE